MNHNFVVIAYNKQKAFVKQLENGPFNEVTDFFYNKTAIKALKKEMSSAAIKLLIPFELEKHGLEIEDVEGWEDAVFWKGKRNAKAFVKALEEFKALLPTLMKQEDWAFYEERLQHFLQVVKAMVEEEAIEYLTFYDLYS